MSTTPSPRRHPSSPITIIFSLTKYFWVLLIPIVRAVLRYGFDLATAFRGYGYDIAVISLLFLWAVSRWKFSYIITDRSTVTAVKGMIIRKTVTVDIRKCTCVKITDNPFTRIFGCHRLSLFTVSDSKPVISMYCTDDCCSDIMEICSFEKENMKKLCFSPAIYSLLFGKSRGGFLLLYAGISVFAVISGKTLSALAADNIAFISKLYSSLPDFLFYGGLILLIARIVAFVTDWLSVSNYRFYEDENRIYITKGIIRREFCRILYNSGYILSTKSIFNYRKYSLYAGISGFGSDKYENNLILPLAHGNCIDNSYGRSRNFVRIYPKKRTVFSYISFSLSFFLLSCFAAGVFFSAYGYGISGIFGYLLPVPFLLRLISDITAHGISQVYSDGKCICLKFFSEACIQNVILNKAGTPKIVIKQNPFQRKRRSCDIMFLVRGEKQKKFVIKQLDKEKCEKLCEKIC